jgi:O-antigen/teichoic acid export membrane protein
MPASSPCAAPGCPFDALSWARHCWQHLPDHRAFRQDLLRISHSSYTNDTTFMLFLLVPALLNCSIGLAGNLMAMTGHSLWNLANSLAIAGVGLLLNALLIPRYGVLGAAGASALAGTMIYSLVLLEARLVLGTTLVWKRIYKPLVAAVPALAITVVFTSLGLTSHPALRVVLALLNTLSFAAALAALKLEPGDREALFPWVSPRRRQAAGAGEP